MLNKLSLWESLRDFYELSTEDSFNQFYLELYKLALHTAFYVTKNHADAEDITQQSFLTVFKKINVCQSLHEQMDIKIKSWFLSIVYNQSKMHLRQKTRRVKRERNTIEQNSKKIQEELIMEHKQNKMQDKELQLAIENLPEKYRTPIILKYKEGLENQNIAEILQLNPSTLRNRMSRGILQLKTMLFKNEKDIEELLPSIAFLPLFGLPNQVQPPSFDAKIALKFTNTKRINLLQNFKFIISSICAVGVVAAGVFYYKSQTTVVPISIATNETKPEQENLKYKFDFTKGSLNNTEIRLGNWEFLEEMRVPELGKDVYIQFNDLNFKQPCRLQVIGGAVYQSEKQDQTNFTQKSGKRSVNYAVQGVYLGTPGPIRYKEVYFKKRAKKSTYVTAKIFLKELIFEKETATIIFIDEYIITEYQGKISKIIKAEENLRDFNKIGIILNSFGLKEIEFESLQTSEVSNYKNIIQELVTQ